MEISPDKPVRARNLATILLTKTIERVPKTGNPSTTVSNQFCWIVYETMRTSDFEMYNESSGLRAIMAWRAKPHAPQFPRKNIRQTFFSSPDCTHKPFGLFWANVCVCVRVCRNDRDDNMNGTTKPLIVLALWCLMRNRNLNADFTIDTVSQHKRTPHTQRTHRRKYQIAICTFELPTS